MNVFKKLPNDMTMLPSKQDTVAVMSPPFPIFFHTIIISIIFLSLHTLGNSATGILNLVTVINNWAERNRMAIRMATIEKYLTSVYLLKIYLHLYAIVLVKILI